MNDNRNNNGFFNTDTKSSFNNKSTKTSVDFNFNSLRNNKFAIITAFIFAIVYYYFLLPPLNIHSIHTWFYIGVILALLGELGDNKNKIFLIFRWAYRLMILACVILVITGLTIFRARSYSDIIKIKDGNFAEDIDELPISKIPTLDRDSSINVGARKMGELLDLVSQFNIDEDTYTQINYRNKPVRVTPLKYNGFLKYIFNSGEGLPGFIKIDIVNGDSELVKLKDKIKFSKEDYFFRDIKRYARLKYPSEIFNDINFEVDDDSKPYWIIPTYKPKISFFSAMDINGAIIINASTGEHKKYSLNEIPSWIDRIYNSDEIIKQLNWNGKYKGGFFNSIFAQKNVLNTTKGYNYLALKDDLYLYTGYTSVAADESNVGFLLSNLRTKETKFYPVSSAEEFSAMKSAEGAVQEKQYKATFPLLLNIKGQPTYFLSLKDNAGLIKLYAFIDAKNYQKVAIGSSVEIAMSNFIGSNVSSKEDSDNNYETFDKQGVVSDFKSVVINGNTHYYFTLNGENTIYVTNINLSDKLPFLEKGKNIKFKYYKKQVNEVILIDSIE